METELRSPCCVRMNISLLNAYPTPTAEHQAKLLSKLKTEFDLTHKEQQVLNRGRNAGSGRNNNRRDPAAYQDSTAFEAVLGYMYIATPDRCGELLQWIDSIVDEI